MQINTKPGGMGGEGMAMNDEAAGPSGWLAFTSAIKAMRIGE